MDKYTKQHMKQESKQKKQRSTAKHETNIKPKKAKTQNNT